MMGFEPLFQILRIVKVWTYLPKSGVLVDFGCDYEQSLLKIVGKRFARRIGVDIVKPPTIAPGIEFYRADLTKTTPLPKKVADGVTMLAVLEHLKNPHRTVAEVFRVLKPGGVFLVTVPTPQAERILPYLAHLHLVRPEMIEQHEHYFTPEQLHQLLAQAGFERIEIQTWELGFNRLAVAYKPS